MMYTRIHQDEGHGGPNIGTHDDGLIEKDLTLDIGDRTFASLTTAPIRLTRSRSHDTALTQNERGERSIRHGAMFVPSLHINDNPDPAARGAQLYVWPGNRTTLGLANEFANPLARVFGVCDVIEAHKPPDPDEPGISAEERAERKRQSWIEAPRSILLAHVCDVVLFELGFRRNEHDRRILLDPLGREAIASALRVCYVIAAMRYRDG